VGQKDPNPFGLHDLHGNDWEWVRDFYGGYDPTPALDPEGPSEGPRRVLRGGSFFHAPELLRSAGRVGAVPVVRLWDYGFRCVRVPARQH
jgi:sulfatase modifying factor 1